MTDSAVDGAAGMAKDVTDGAVDAGKDMAKDAMGMDKN